MGKHRIKNFDDLATNKYRRDALDIVEAAYSAIDTESVIKDKVSLDGEVLKICDESFDLGKYEHIYVLGFGKVACRAASVLESALKGSVKEGAVIGIGDGVCQTIETYKGTHPLPSEVNFEGTSRIEKIGRDATEKDLVLVIIGGGGSSLLCSSESEFKQGRRLYEDFLNSGGDISELNTIRKHISELKGGGLAKLLYPATVVGLIFSDIPGGNCSIVASGPTYKDETTIEDAEAIIKKYGLKNFDLVETPKEDKFFEKVKNIVLVSNVTALDVMQKVAEEKGYSSSLIGCDLYNFPKETIEEMDKLSKEVSVVVAGGETKMIVPKDCNGKGGRNDYLAMEMLDHIKENQVFVAFASDGCDNSESAGAIVDFETNAKIKDLGIDLSSHKVCLDSFTLFEKTGNLIFTGQIEANVSDLMILLTYVKD